MIRLACWATTRHGNPTPGRTSFCLCGLRWHVRILGGAA
jgi:hypothetical protein